MAAWAAILYLTAQSDNVAEGLAEQLTHLKWLTNSAGTISASIVPAAVTIINAIMPIIIKVLFYNNRAFLLLIDSCESVTQRWHQGSVENIFWDT